MIHLFSALARLQSTWLFRGLLLCAVISVQLVSMGCGTERRETPDPVDQPSQRDLAAAIMAPAKEGDSASARQGTAKSSKPKARSTAELPSEAQLGLPIYPNAIVSTEKDGKPSDNSGKGTNITMSKGINIAVLETPDSLSRVIAFYQKRLSRPLSHGTRVNGKSVMPPDIQEMNLGGTHLVRMTGPQNGKGLRIVEVREGDGKTYIELMNIQTSKAADATLASPNLYGGRDDRSGKSDSKPLPTVTFPSGPSDSSTSGPH
jgi:hypothetical protein